MSIPTQLIIQFIKTTMVGLRKWRSYRILSPVSSIIHCQNMLFLVRLKFNNLTGSVNTPLFKASVLPCGETSPGARSRAE